MEIPEQEDGGGDLEQAGGGQGGRQPGWAGDEDDECTLDGGGGRGLKDKLKDPNSRRKPGDSRQGSSASLLGDEDDEGTLGGGGGGGRGLKDKLKDPNSRRKPGDSLEEDLIPGNLHLELLKAENLPKSDLIGKSDPYAVISFDDEKHKTKSYGNNVLARR